MNERIKLLAEQAGLQLGIVIENSTTPVKTITIEQRKFAELIVRECAEVIFKTPVEYIEIDAMHRIRDNVKSHFGVE